MQVSAAAGALAARLRIRRLLGCKRGVPCRYRLQPEVVLLTDIPGLAQSGSSIKEFAPRWEAIVPPSCEDISAEAHSLSTPGPLHSEYCFQCIARERIFLKSPFQQGIEMMLSSRA